MTTNSSAAAQDAFYPSSDFWSNAAAWSLGGAPTATQDAFVGAGVSGAASADVTASVTVNSIAVNAASALTVANGTFTATNGTTLAASDASSLGAGNAGLINVTGGATLALGGAFVNAGGVEIGRANLGDSGALQLLGDVTLSGGGRIDLGIQQGAASTTAPIEGDGLVNIDNVISGAGVISLATLDNRAGGVIVAGPSSNEDLTLDVAQMSNEGALRVAAGATMRLGQDGQSSSLSNSGIIAVGYEGAAMGANAHLLIAGDVTVSGTGALDLMGDNNLVTSDQATSSFTNAGAILATASAEIGDGGQGFDDLTFINSGSMTATGAGVTLTLDTPTFAIADSGLLQALSGATLTLASEIDITGAGAVIEAGSGGGALISAPVVDEGGAGGLVVDSGGQMTLASGAAAAAATIHGASGAIAGGALTVQKGASVTGAITFASAGGVLNLLYQGAPLTVSGNGGLITLTSASVVTSGSGDTISALGLTGDFATVGGTAETLTGAHANFALLGGASAALTGGDDTVTSATGASLTVGGIGETLSGGRASFALLAGASAALTGDHDAVTVAAGASLTLIGSGDTIVAAANASVSLVGDGGLGADTITASGATLTIAANAQAQVSGADDILHIRAGASLNLTGTGDRLVGAYFSVTAASGADFLIGDAGSWGTADTVNASNGAIRVGSYGNADISGIDDTAAARPHSHVSVDGAGMIVHFAGSATGAVGGNGETGVLDTMRGAYFSASVLADSDVDLGTLGASVTVGDQANVQVNRTGNVVTAGAADTIDVYGRANEVVLGTSDVVTDYGDASVFAVGAFVGAARLVGFGADSLAQLDLTNGVGGFASASAAYAALTSDGAGGLDLALGAAGSIDFVGVSAAMLTAANFKIG